MLLELRPATPKAPGLCESASSCPHCRFQIINHRVQRPCQFERLCLIHGALLGLGSPTPRTFRSEGGEKRAKRATKQGSRGRSPRPKFLGGYF